MNKRTGAVSLLVVAFLALGMCPGPANGDPGPRPDSDGMAGPIGVVHSLGGAVVNGRVALGETPIWSGTVVQAAPDAAARVALESIGHVTVEKGAAVRLATQMKNRPTLIAAVISGDLFVELDPDVAAYLESAGVFFTASRGSAFRIKLRDYQPVVEVSSGEVIVEQQPPQRRYVVRPVGLGSTISVRARSTRQIQVQVTDENDKPVPDLPILFALGGRGAGSLGTGVIPRTTATITTDSRGIARVNFTASDNPGSDSISATVEGTRYSWIAQITVTAAGGGFWSTGNTLLVIGAAAGGATAITLGLRGGREPIRVAPPPRVNP